MAQARFYGSPGTKQQPHNRLHKEGVGDPSLQVPKASLDGSLGSMICWGALWPLSTQPFSGSMNTGQAL